jgi:hypothetical protein
MPLLVAIWVVTVADELGNPATVGSEVSPVGGWGRGGSGRLSCVGDWSLKVTSWGTVRAWSISVLGSMSFERLSAVEVVARNAGELGVGGVPDR